MLFSIFKLRGPTHTVLKGLKHMPLHADMEMRCSIKQKGIMRESWGRGFSTPASYKRIRSVKSRPGDKLYSLKFFVISLSSSSKTPEYSLELGYECFFFQFVIH